MPRQHHDHNELQLPYQRRFRASCPAANVTVSNGARERLPGTEAMAAEVEAAVTRSATGSGRRWEMASGGWVSCCQVADSGRVIEADLTGT